MAQITDCTVDRKILLEKVTCLGIKAPVIKWFESHQSNRKFLVSQKLEYQNCGVPQVFTLRPILFLINILLISLNHYQKGALIFMLMIRVLSR